MEKIPSSHRVQLPTTAENTDQTGRKPSSSFFNIPVVKRRPSTLLFKSAEFTHRETLKTPERYAISVLENAKVEQPIDPKFPLGELQIGLLNQKQGIYFSQVPKGDDQRLSFLKFILDNNITSVVSAHEALPPVLPSQSNNFEDIILKSYHVEKLTDTGKDTTFPRKRQRTQSETVLNYSPEPPYILKIKLKITDSTKADKSGHTLTLYQVKNWQDKKEIPNDTFSELIEQLPSKDILCQCYAGLERSIAVAFGIMMKTNVAQDKLTSKNLRHWLSEEITKARRQRGSSQLLNSTKLIAMLVSFGCHLTGKEKLTPMSPPIRTTDDTVPHSPLQRNEDLKATQKKETP